MSHVNAAAIAQHLDNVRAGIAAAAINAGRTSGDVTLIAVTKNHGPDAVAAAIAAGQRHFGENRVQEAIAKYPEIKQRHPDVVLHLIGPLQSNKVRDAVKTFDVIHSLDRPKLAAKLATEMRVQKRRLPCFIQVNTGHEAQKAGIEPAQLPSFLARCRIDLHMDIVGLMCIPPVNEDPALHFAFLRELARDHGLANLSMGMSADAETAVTFGATHVRVGTAIFGARASTDPDLEFDTADEIDLSDG